MVEKRKNYELLLKRREQKLKNRLNRQRTNAENVEEMLFEQVSIALLELRTETMLMAFFVGRTGARR